jgi:hypothetical protein
LSGNGNDGVFSGTVLPTKDLWLLWWAYYFWSWWTNNNTWYLQILNNDNLNNLPNGLTISTIIKTSTCSPGSFIIMKSWPKVDSIAYQTGSIDYSNKTHWYNWWLYIPHSSCAIDSFWFYAVNQILNVETNIYKVGSYIYSSWIPASNNIITNKSVIRDNQYHIITSTVDGKWNTRKIYIDGIKLSEFTVPIGEQNYGIRKSIWDFFIWSSIINTNWLYWKWGQFNWLIDDVKIYNRALSDSEIKQHAKAAGF